MSTTLDLVDHEFTNQALHTTQITTSGITLYRSREQIRLQDDGVSFHLAGMQAFFPQLWRMADWSAVGSVDIDHQSAVYNFSFFGEPMQQSTRVTSEGLEISQETPFSQATILLKMQSLAAMVDR